MFNLKAEQKTIQQFMGESTNLFLIPDYQRPYSWEEEECNKLWEDIFSFAFPNNDCSSFHNDLYFLGSLVIFKNSSGQLEVIDGQQRLITMTLLLRAFYAAYGSDMADEASRYAKWEIAKCLWHIPTIGGTPDMSALKIKSDVASDDENHEFSAIMHDGTAERNSEGKYGRYAQNYILFQRKIKDFQEKYPSYFQVMPDRILKNCCILPIETDGQDTALRIFSTMNDRGMPLSDSDIFKAKLYKAYSEHGQRELFIQQWREFEEVCRESCRVDDIFMRYMHYARASNGIKDTTVEGLRDFYGRDDEKFSLLVRDYSRTFGGLRVLADFWKDVAALDSARFSEPVCKSLFVLHYVPNNVWTFLVSVYFMTCRTDGGMLDNIKFHAFLQKITGFILASRIMRPGNSTPFFTAMTDIAQGKNVTFNKYEFDESELRRRMQVFDFNDSRKITRGMIAWYVFQDNSQTVLPLDTRFDTEHIYPRARLKHEGAIPITTFESLGNKSLLEKSINIRASDYRFRDKAKYYLGLIPSKPATQIHELQVLAETMQDFTASDIQERSSRIIDTFIKFMGDNHLLIRQS